MDDNIWEIRPRVGLGKLRLGSSPEQIAQLNDTYGMVGSVIDDADRYGDLDEFAKQFGFSEEDLGAVHDALGDQAAQTARKTEYRIDANLSLIYEGNALVSIQVSRGIERLNFGGELFFHTKPRKFLGALEASNAEPPLVHGPDCVFANIGVFVWALLLPLVPRKEGCHSQEQQEDEAQCTHTEAAEAGKIGEEH